MAIFLLLLAFGLLLQLFVEDTSSPFCSIAISATFLSYVIGVNTLILVVLIMVTALAFYYEFKNIVNIIISYIKYVTN
ncbi:TPA: hypothetical protein QCY08_005360 [Bacillus paranthracis]|nr:hypothetical protein [Bacillus paranthracis]